jgi:transmembrane 9 superfamily protein 1
MFRNFSILSRLQFCTVYTKACFSVFQTRVLKSDFARYNLGEDDDSEDLDQDDNGWKIIQTDVFRFPPCKNLFCAILGRYSLFACVCV